MDDLFTVVIVHNVRLLFHRLSGQFDGIVVDQKDCRQNTIEAMTSLRNSVASESAGT